MRTLYLLRHAKSSWDDASLSDSERPLNPRGQRDAPRMGRALGNQLAPMTFHISPAERALHGRFYLVRFGKKKYHLLIDGA